MKIHKQYLTCYAAVDLRTLSDFYTIDYTGERHDPVVDPIQIGCANKEVIVLLAKDINRFNSLPLAAKKCQKFKEI